MKVSARDIEELYRLDFTSFAGFAFRELHPGTVFQDNFHLDVMGDYLAKCVQGEIKRLIINVPPRYLKSHFASVALPAFLLAKDPSNKVLCVSGGIELAQQLEADTLHLMSGSRYRALFPHVRTVASDQGIRLSHGGSRRSAAMWSNLTGLGADCIIVDDPMPASVANDAKARRKYNDLFDASINQRLDSKSDGVVIVVMQRLHADDLCGHLLTQSDEWTVVSLPAIAPIDETWKLANGIIHTRGKGEALHPARESRDQLLETLLNVKAQIFSMQYQQGTFTTQCGPKGTRVVHLNYDLYVVPEEIIMAMQIFGETGLLPDEEPELSVEEFERYAMAQQAALRADVERDRIMYDRQRDERHRSG